MIGDISKNQIGIDFHFIAEHRIRKETETEEDKKEEHKLNGDHGVSTISPKCYLCKSCLSH